METTMNGMRPDTSNPADDVRQQGVTSRPAGRPDDDVVRWREFRQAQWLVGIALAAILSSQGFLYAAIMGLQRDIQIQISDLRTDLRTELHTEINKLRAEMQAQFADIRDEIDILREEIAVLREQVYALSERVARIETRLDMDAVPADPAG